MYLLDKQYILNIIVQKNIRNIDICINIDGIFVVDEITAANRRQCRIAQIY